MKLIWFFLSIYLVTLSILPCSDKNECDNKHKKEQAKFSKSNNHSQHRHENEQCAPFCICACCGAQTYQLQVPFINLTENKVFAHKKKQIFTYVFIYSKEFSSPIWQPPKMC